MKLGSIRTLEGLKPVLKDPNSTGPDPVYWVFYEVSTLKWANNTIIAPGKLGSEFCKTFGHYHPEDTPDEIYHVVSGEGVLQLQKKHFENGQLTPEKVEQVFLIKAKPGDEIVIKKEFGHSWSNIGETPLIQFDNWRSGHSPDDYKPIESLHGMAYYLIEDSGAVKSLANPNYVNPPQPKWITPQELEGLSS